MSSDLRKMMPNPVKKLEVHVGGPLSTGNILQHFGSSRAPEPKETTQRPAAWQAFRRLGMTESLLQVLPGLQEHTILYQCRGRHSLWEEYIQTTGFSGRVLHQSYLVLRLPLFPSQRLRPALFWECSPAFSSWHSICACPSRCVKLLLLWSSYFPFFRLQMTLPWLAQVAASSSSSSSSTYSHVGFGDNGLVVQSAPVEVFIASNLVGSCCKVPGLDQFMKWRRPFLLAEVYAVLTAVWDWAVRRRNGQLNWRGWFFRHGSKRVRDRIRTSGGEFHLSQLDQSWNLGWKRGVDDVQQLLRYPGRSCWVDPRQDDCISFLWSLPPRFMAFAARGKSLKFTSSAQLHV